MLKNKIYKYFSIEIGKSFFTILFAFTAIAWTVRAVNFLDLIVEDGYSVSIYLYYSFLNISTIITRFIPLSFLLALVISILKFERQNELIILWTVGLSKIQAVRLFLYIATLVTILQIFLAVIITPSALNKSRSLLKNSDLKSFTSVIKTNDFSDSFQYITFYVEEKNNQNEMKNIFIRDESNSLNTIISKSGDTTNTTIIADKGMIKNNKLILFDGVIQSQNKDNIIKNINFSKTELSINKFKTRTITLPKIQETSTLILLSCFVNKNYFFINPQQCTYSENKKEVTQQISRRIGMPTYIPLVSLIVSFLLVYKKKKKYIFLNKYIYFIISFFILVLAEIMVRYSGFSKLNTVLYFTFPFILMPIIYWVLSRSLSKEKKTR